MKTILAVIFTMVSLLSVSAQTEKVKGQVSTIDTADLTILGIYPDSFPNVSVVFKAETRKGEPVWNLKLNEMVVKENGQLCKVNSLEQISKKTPINVMVVLDHSGSMACESTDDCMRLWGWGALPDGKKSPLDNAITAIKSFMSSFNAEKDYLGLKGFSEFVDLSVPLTHDISGLNPYLDSLIADRSTALYDAMLAGVEALEGSNGVKVLVVLTDGWDNASKSDWEDVVKRANVNEIPIYIIGLGDVQVDTLTWIAKATKGKFYHTHSSTSLDTIYEAISKQVNAFYNLVYSSENFISADGVRAIELSFDVDGLYMLSTIDSAQFPVEMIAFMAKKKQEQEEREKLNMVLGGGASVIVVATGTLLLINRRRKRKQNKLYISKLYPNPTNGVIHLEYTATTGHVVIINTNGQIVMSLALSGTELELDLSELADGRYSAMIQSGTQSSNALQFVLIH